MNPVTYLGKKSCGCTVTAVVGKEPSPRPGITWERVPAGQEVRFNLCRCEVKK